MVKLIYIVVFGALIWLGLLQIRRYLKYRKGGDGLDAATTLASRIVPCAHCGVHIPEADAISHRGQFFCCKKHRQLEQG
ncbi:MAG TPA: hypothetical protein ENI80_07155 [Acidiferrobacteraceae bacterium]|nr:hypothetical protein [Acidiferrobacteraceae bacterium]